MTDTTKRIDQGSDWVVPEKYQDRMKIDRLATQQEAMLAVEIDRCDKPIAIWLDAVELQRLNAQRVTPYDFSQYLLRKFRDAGAPVEGMLNLRLSHGAVAKVRPDPQLKEMGFRYLWMPAEMVAAVASKR
jgi:hypothetical protein